jgi:hypothetical protein
MVLSIVTSCSLMSGFPEFGGGMFLRNVTTYLPDYKLS